MREKRLWQAGLRHYYLGARGQSSCLCTAHGASSLLGNRIRISPAGGLRTPADYRNAPIDLPFSTILTTYRNKSSGVRAVDCTCRAFRPEVPHVPPACAC